ncbi:polysaccharide deacetylase family protein [Burkholderia pyrrocinia]|uniref:polysaccharide deacetylase family protein n=1 Tax=Burkholderia sp. IT-111MI5 TaxID=3026439 RepID=UPI002A33862A|nr:polysaccharide deacetylase family protein [Burkholderia pyrrocinia]EKS9892051.1 polysaccharide deacetylase family protein [Burkholderia pyrrocinia]EKS9906412.1 polysaccharide deacetylase family protein [Burkholderia pyrrocinia]
MNAPSSVPPRQPGQSGARRWKPTPLIAGTVALHAGAAATVVTQPAAWPWAVGGVVASHLALTAAGLWPRSTLLGPNWTRLPAGADRRIALTIDDGPDPDVTPRVLDLLDRYDARATFFCIGDLARRHPRWIEAIVARGHAIENHSQRHRHSFSLSGPAALRREIAAAQQTLTEIAGTRPLFFRAPAGLRNPFLEPVLCELGLQLASWTRRGFDTRAHDAATVTRRLLHGLAPRDILLVHDGHAARDARGEPVVLDVLQAVLRAAADAQLHWTTLRAALAPEPPGQPGVPAPPFDKI